MSLLVRERSALADPYCQSAWNSVCVGGPCLLDYLILKLRLPVVLYVSFAVVSR